MVGNDEVLTKVLQENNSLTDVVVENDYDLAQHSSSAVLNCPYKFFQISSLSQQAES